MATITDEYMREMLPKARQFCAVILKVGPKRNQPGVEAIIWEHGRRNMALREDGIMPIVCPVGDGSEVAGLSILNLSLDDARALMDGDPGVQAGVFVYELHPCRGFPGSCLPG